MDQPEGVFRRLHRRRGRRRRALLSRPDRTLPFDDGYSNWTEDDGFDVVRNNEFVSLQSDDLRAVACQPVLGAMAARLAGSAGIQLLDDQLVYKPPSAPGAMTAVGWHADHAYWGTCSSERLLTAWIPFHDVDEESGTLAVLDGSHRWPDIQHARFFDDADLDAIAQWARGRGNSIVHLGGGVGGAIDDSLFAFKAGFSHRRHPYRTLRLVADQQRYHALIQEQARRVGSTTEELLSSGFFPAYFPAYRATPDSSV